MISNDTILGRLVRLPLRLIPRSMNAPILSGLLKGAKWRVGALTHGCWLGTYESDKQSVVARFVRAGMVVYDIGAHSGYYTLLFSKLVGANGVVHAFEPFAPNIANLLHHITINGVSNATVTACALSTSDGLSNFQVSMSTAMGKLGQETSQLRVPTFSIDELISRFQYQKPDVIKMDVEGEEGRVLAGAAALLKEKSCVWFIALHGDDQRKRCERLLREAGYTMHSFDDRKLESIPPDVDEIYAVPAVR